MKAIKIKDQEFLVDTEDYEFLNKWKWKLDKYGYAVRNVAIGTFNGKQKYKTIRMHRLIMNAPSDRLVDHINRDIHDNQKSNLRLCTKADNQRNTGVFKTNTTGYKGVAKHRNKWVAYIHINNRKKHLGMFTTKEMAAKAYNLAAIEYFGEFAAPNIIAELDVATP